MEEEENAVKSRELSPEEVEANKKRRELLHNILKGPARQIKNFPDFCLS